jgi:hypothetical protein
VLLPRSTAQQAKAKRIYGLAPTRCLPLGHTDPLPTWATPTRRLPRNSHVTKCVHERTLRVCARAHEHACARVRACTAAVAAVQPTELMMGL